MKCAIDPANPSLKQMGCHAFLRTRSMPLKLTFPQPSFRMKFQKEATVININQEVVFNVFDPNDSMAHCVSAYFNMSAGIAPHFKCKFPTTYPSDSDHSCTPSWPHWLPETRRYLYYLVKKQKKLLNQRIAHIELP